jgi:hypothetical protein
MYAVCVSLFLIDVVAIVLLVSFSYCLLLLASLKIIVAHCRKKLCERILSCVMNYWMK